MRRGMMSGETFLFFLITLSSLYRPFKKLLTLNVALQRPLMAARAIFKTMDVQPRMVEKSDARGFPERWHTLHFDNVWFRYGEKDHWPWVLRDIDLIVPRGQLVAMLGHNGSGKTTAAMLLARLYDPVRGSVRIDDVDFRSIRQSEIRRHIGLVHQGSIIFNLSVAENIAFGLEPDEIDMSRVQVVARRVGADRWIEKLPKGFDTILGRRGEVLSGGQQQLIALCRVLYFDFPIIVYDEPYQSLDPHAMEQVANLISELRRDKTILVITHNLPLAEMADRRIVLSDGRLIADSDDIAIDQLALMDHLKQVEVGSTA
ncbi:MAG: ABC transporter ATP-binding protein [Acidobacteria bacterium]|nr:ABC transporter ATP-binding protein [Candidatus Sulfomarinibacter kjeldsenii]